MNRIALHACLLASAGIALASPALAITDVVIPVGEWSSGIVSFISTFVTPLVVAGVAFMFRHVPSAYVTTQNRAAVEQLLEKAIQFGLNAAKSKLPANVTLPVSSDVVAIAARYAIANGPKVVAWAGGAKAIEDKIYARLNVTPAAP